MLNKVFLTLVGGLFLFSGLGFSANYTVEASNTNTGMLAHYRLIDSHFEMAGGIPTIVAETEGDCRVEQVWRCRDYRYDDHHGHWDHDYNRHDGYHWHTVCGYESEKYCSYQTGRYPLPSDQIIFDGKKRIKFIGDGQYQTIGRNNRKWYYAWLNREWELIDESVDVEVAPDFSKVSLHITVDQ